MTMQTREIPNQTPLRCSILALVVAATVLLSGVASAQTEYEDLRDGAMQMLGARIQAGQREAARDDLAVYVARHPGDAIMQYNLACMLASSGEPDSALVRLGKALATGYRDLRRVRTSPDLVSLADDPRLEALLDSVQAGWLERMLAGELYLEEGAWSDPLPLQPEPSGPLPAAAAGSVRFSFDRDHLTAEITAPDGGAHELIAVVALPFSLERHETARWFELRAPLDATGSVTLTSRTGREEPLRNAADLERTPLGWQLEIPWSSLHPYRPPVELMLGLNIVLRRQVGPDLPAQRWALIDDPHAGSRLQPWRRFVPANLDPGLDPAPLLAGRLDNYLVIGDSLSVEFGLQAAAEGPATLVLRTGQEMATTTAETVLQLDLEPDLAYFTADLRLEHLPTPGWFTVTAEVTDTEGVRYTWRDRAFRLSPDWFVRQYARLQAVAPAEQAIVQFQLIGTLRGQQSFHPHDDPEPLAQSANACMQLLDRAERTGSVLPVEACLLHTGFPTGQDQLVACQLVLPAVEARRGGEVVLVVVADRQQAAAVAEILHQGRPAGDRRSYLVTATRQTPGQPHTAVPEIRASSNWIRELLEPAAVSLVGIGMGAEMALHAALEDPDAWQALLLLGGAGFDPALLTAPEAIVAEIAGRLGRLPLVLSLPAESAPRTRALADLLPGALPGLVVEERSAAAQDPAAALAGRVLTWQP
jgi:hypothetical protein